MNWWGLCSDVNKINSVYSFLNVTAADKPVLSSQFYQKSLNNFFSKAHFLKTSYWPVGFSSKMHPLLKGSYLKCKVARNAKDRSYCCYRLWLYRAIMKIRFENENLLLTMLRKLASSELWVYDRRTGQSWALAVFSVRKVEIKSAQLWK